MSKLQLVFKTVSASAMAEVDALLEPNEYDAGTTLMNEGDPHDSLLFLERGEVDLSIGGLHLKTLGAGALLGEISLFGHGTRTVTAVARTPIAFQRLRRAAFEDLRARHHPFVFAVEKRVCRSLAERLHELADEIATLGLRSPLVEIVPGPLSVGMPLPSTPNKIQALLSATPGFEDADADWLASMAPDLTLRGWKAGEHLTSATHPVLGFLLVAQGEIERFAAPEPTRGVRLAVWGPGAMAGIAGLLDAAPLRGFVVTTVNTTGLTAPLSVFQRWMAADTHRGSHFRRAVLRDLANQVTNANATQSMLHLLTR